VPKDFPACQESSELLEHKSSIRIHSGSMEFSELYFGQVQELYQNFVNSDRGTTLESL
jgi:hypothetical protein